MEPRALRITVPATSSTSSVWVGRDILPTLATLVHSERYSKVLVVGDRGALQIVERVAHHLGSDQSRMLLIRGGEECKSLASLEHIWAFFVDSKLDRRGLVVAVGGGALSDLVGFAAATYMRGVACAVVPTTLLAQVDASIGGKSGINFKGVKNILGAIAQPVDIVIDIAAIESLPPRDLRSGFAEIVKHGLIADRAYFDLVTSRDCAAWRPEELIDIIFQSCAIKCSIVEHDTTEQGLRKALNFGHSLGHAIEAYALQSGVSLTHGEAVAIGMNAASFISQRMGLLTEDRRRRALDGIIRTGLPTSLPTAMESARLLEFLTLDKKSVAGVTRWTLLTDIGVPAIDQQVPLPIVKEAITHIQPHPAV